MPNATLAERQTDMRQRRETEKRLAKTRRINAEVGSIAASHRRREDAERRLEQAKQRLAAAKARGAQEKEAARHVLADGRDIDAEFRKIAKERRYVDKVAKSREEKHPKPHCQSPARRRTRAAGSRAVAEGKRRRATRAG